MAAKSSIVVVALALGLLLVVPCPADAQSESVDGQRVAHPPKLPWRSGTVKQVSARYYWPNNPIFNFWNPQQYPGNGTDPQWGNVEAGTANDIRITDGVEFGWSSKTMMEPTWQATLDVSTAELEASDVIDLTLTLRTKTTAGTASYGSATSGFVIAATSAAFIGSSSVELLPGNTLPKQPTSTDLNSEAGTVTVAFPVIFVTAPSNEVVQTASWRIKVCNPAKGCCGVGHDFLPAHTKCRVERACASPKGVCSGKSTVCQVKEFEEDGTACAWAPEAVGHHHHYAAGAEPVSVATAAAMLAEVEPQAYGAHKGSKHEWPACHGECSKGECTLSRSSVASKKGAHGHGCCVATKGVEQKGEGYEAKAGDDSSPFYCWGKKSQPF